MDRIKFEDFELSPQVGRAIKEMERVGIDEA